MMPRKATSMKKAVESSYPSSGSQDRAGPIGELRPVGAEFSRHHHPGHDADPEDDHKYLQPVLVDVHLDRASCLELIQTLEITSLSNKIARKRAHVNNAFVKSWASEELLRYDLGSLKKCAPNQRPPLIASSATLQTTNIVLGQWVTVFESRKLGLAWPKELYGNDPSSRDFMTEATNGPRISAGSRASPTRLPDCLIGETNRDGT